MVLEHPKYQGVIPDDLEDLKNVHSDVESQPGDVLTVESVDERGRPCWRSATPSGGGGGGGVDTAVSVNPTGLAVIQGADTNVHLALARLDAAVNGKAEAFDPGLFDPAGSASTAAAGAAAAILDGATFSGEVIVPDVKVVGLTGATTASRYVGATTGGAPVAFPVGGWLANDWCMTPAGIMICTVANGGIGVWSPAGAGFELGYDEATANETRTGATTNASMSDQVTITFPCPPSAFIVEGWALSGSVATAGGRGQLTLGSAGATVVYALDTVTSAASGDADRLEVRTRLSPGKLGVNPGDALTFELFKKVYNSVHTLTLLATSVTPIVLRAYTVL